MAYPSTRLIAPLPIRPPRSRIDLPVRARLPTVLTPNPIPLPPARTGLARSYGPGGSRFDELMLKARRLLSLPIPQDHNRIQQEAQADNIQRQESKSPALEPNQVEQTEEERREAQLEADRLLAESIAKAVHDDAEEIERLLRLEEKDARNFTLARQFAEQLGDGPDVESSDEDESLEASTSPDEPKPAATAFIPDDDSVKQPSITDVIGNVPKRVRRQTTKRARALPESTAQQLHYEEHFRRLKRAKHTSQSDEATHGFAEEPEISVCAACMDEVTYHNSVKLPCNDIYCKPCLRQMFVNATNDEAAYPPKCCKLDIPLTEVLRPCFGVLSKVQVKEFKERAEEYETAKRVYCHKCGKFIKKRHVKMKVEQAKCIKCKEATCIHCGKDVHEGDCPEDEGMQKLLELSKQEKWTRCSKCKRFVEKVVGCDHITCPCGYQFCYLCGALWELAHPCYMD